MGLLDKAYESFHHATKSVVHEAEHIFSSSEHKVQQTIGSAGHAVNDVTHVVGDVEHEVEKEISHVTSAIEKDVNKVEDFIGNTADELSNDINHLESEVGHVVNAAVDDLEAGLQSAGEEIEHIGRVVADEAETIAEEVENEVGHVITAVKKLETKVVNKLEEYGDDTVWWLKVLGVAAGGVVLGILVSGLPSYVGGAAKQAIVSRVEDRGNRIKRGVNLIANNPQMAAVVPELAPIAANAGTINNLVDAVQGEVRNL